MMLPDGTIWYQNKMLVGEVLSHSWKLTGKPHLKIKKRNK